MSLLERLAKNAKRYPDFPAFDGSSGTYTYGAMMHFADFLSRGLIDGAVIVEGHKEQSMVSTFLAAMLSGVPFVPFDNVLMPAARRDQYHQLLEDSEWDTSGRAPLSDPRRPAYILFTSGSTGQPKGVVVPMEALDHFVDATIRVHDLPLDSGETWLNVASWSFDLSVLDTWVGLATAGTVLPVRRVDIEEPKLLFTLFTRWQVDNWVSTPSFADFCLAEPLFNDMLIQPKRFFFCGEVLKPSTAKRLLTRFPGSKVYNLYGPTEACCAVSSVEVTLEMCERPALPCGKPYPDMTVRIDDGEVVILGPQVALGYLNGPADVFFEENGVRGYRTGDTGYFEGDQLFITGRLDRQVKVGGYRLELGEIESVLRSFDGVVDAAVTVSPKGHLRAYVSTSRNPRELRALLAERLPAYMVPSYIGVSTGPLPMTPNMKLDMGALEEKW